MTGRVAGKVAFITGAARGQGRAHAVRLAQEGADIIALDICAPIENRESIPAATPEDLAETVRLVEAQDRRAIGVQADIRDLGALQSAVAQGIEAFGHIDVLVANAGASPANVRVEDITEADFDTVVSINLKGTWLTVKAVLPHMVERRSGSVILISSGAGLMGMANIGEYVASKHAVIGLMKTLAIENGQHEIRVNAVCPGTVRTPMFDNPTNRRLFRPDLEEPTFEDTLDGLRGLSLFPSRPILQPEDISEGVLWLASDEARYVTGVALPIDLGTLVM